MVPRKSWISETFDSISKSRFFMFLSVSECRMFSQGLGVSDLLFQQRYFSSKSYCVERAESVLLRLSMVFTQTAAK